MDIAETSDSLNTTLDPNQGHPVTVLGVEYTHYALPGGDELYVTPYGYPFLQSLHPDNYWTDKEWFQENSIPLFGHSSAGKGSGTLYRVQTKEVEGRSTDIVIKWNRMGQDIPGGEGGSDLADAEFNSPYEEFALLMEMRNSRLGVFGRILTHKPLAIYVPARRVELWKSGRREARMQAKLRSHTEIELDMFRSYAVIYEWIKGIDAVQAMELGLLSEREMRTLTLQVENSMREKGFLVHDRKPHHVIVRPTPKGTLLRMPDGTIPHAVIDFELLERTPHSEKLVREAKRKEYLLRQAHRFDSTHAAPLPAHLKQTRILGVDYLQGPAESTGGMLWVVGRDPSLFDYFLPERWRWVPRTKLSNSNQMYHVLTKDNIHLVWKVSRVGQHPDVDPFNESERRILAHGHNSPFEEVALAYELARKGVPTIYPRAIYMTGHESRVSDALRDNSRYDSHQHLRLPDGSPILRPDRDYILIWGYWNKPDELLAERDAEYYQGIDALQALHKGLLTEDGYIDLMERMKKRMADAGMEELNLRGHHKLLSLDSSGKLVRDKDGFPSVRISNFEFLRKLKLLS